MPVSAKLEPYERARQLAEEAELRGENAWNYGKLDTAKNAWLLAARKRVEAEELEEGRFVPVHAVK